MQVQWPGSIVKIKDYIKSAHEDNCSDNHMTFYYMHTSINTGRGSEFRIKHSFTTFLPTSTLVHASIIMTSVYKEASCLVQDNEVLFLEVD